MGKLQVVGILWIAQADYDRAVVLSEDGMPATYEDWRKKIDKVVAGLPAGIKVIRIEADPDEVAKWCRANGHRVDTHGRSAFAAFAANRKMQN
jgi:hypothetical protein